MLSITLFVDGDAAPGGDGLGWGTAYDDLQSALTQAATFNADTNASNDVDQIWVAEGTYLPTAELNPGNARSASFSLIDGVALYGGFVGNETAITERDLPTHTTTLSGDLGVSGDEADNAYSVVCCGRGIEAELNGLMITGGNADLNYAYCCGGGIFNWGTLLLTDSTLTGNFAVAGGGIYNCEVASLSVNNSAFFDNSAEAGGAIANFGTLEITNSTFSGNSAESGGAIYNESIGYQAATAVITNSTIVNNSVTDCGGGICNMDDNYTAPAATITLNNSVVAGNDVGNKDDIKNVGILTGSHNLIGNGKNQSALVDGVDGNLVGTDSSPIDPLLGILQDNGGPTWTHNPLPGSPLIDAGDNSIATSPEGKPLMMDQRGLLRSYGTVDIGAVESQPVGVPIAYGDCFELSQNNSLTLNSSNLLGNDISTDGSSLTVQIVNTPQHGNLVQNQDGTYTYMPEADFWGIDTFSYRAANDPVESNEVEVLLSVLSPQSVVVTTTEDEQDGNLTPEDISLREAMLDLEASQVQFAIDLVGKEILLTLGKLTVNDASVYGLGEQYLTINGNGQSQVFYVTGNDSAISHLTITGGYQYGGAGIDNVGTLIVSNVTLSGNSVSGDGGAIRNQGTLTVCDSTITGNSAGGAGGGIFNDDGKLTLANTTVMGNSADDGGGLWNNAEATVINSTFSNNSAESGGGIFNNGNMDGNNSLAIVGSTLFDNSASFYGGGITSFGNHLSILNSTLSNNIGGEFGGGIYNVSNNLTITNSTLTGNKNYFLYQPGSGIYNRQSDSVVTLNNTVVAANGYDPDIYTTGSLLSGSNNFIGFVGDDIGLVNGVDGNVVGTSSPIDPQLGPLQDNGGPTLTHAPLAGSPLLDAGDPAKAVELSGFPLTTDQRGLSREFGAVDIGAVESQPLGVPIANSDAFELAKDHSLTMGREDLLTNDTSTDGSPLSIQIASNPRHGTLVENLDGTFTYTPSEDFWGTDFFSYQAVNGELVSNGTNVFLLVKDPQSVIVTTADDEQDGNLSPEDISLREAIDDLGASQIQFSNDLLYQEIRLTNGVLSIASDIQIIGPGVEYLTIHGNHQTNVFNFTSGTSAISRLTIAGGSSTNGGAINNAAALTISEVVFTDNVAQGSGGVIYNTQGNLIISDTVFKYNTSLNSGGVIDNYQSNLTITNSQFIGNSASYRGGVIQHYGSPSNVVSLSIADSLFTDNSASGNGGGAIYAFGGVMNISSSTFSGNTSGKDGGAIATSCSGIIAKSTFTNNVTANDGGAIHVGSSMMTIMDSTLAGNTADNGGAIYNIGGLTLLQTTLSGNSADVGGGAVFNNGDLGLTNCTLTENTADDGGGLYDADANSSVTLNNSVIAANDASDGPDIYNLEGQLSGAHNLIGDETGQAIFVNGVDGNLVGNRYRPIDPKLGPLQDNGGPTLTHLPMDGSPLIDAGDDSLARNHLEWDFVTDQRGLQRHFGTVDIGATEFQPEGVPVAHDDFLTLEQNGSITFSRADLLANDFYNGTETLTFPSYGWSCPEGCTFVENSDGTFTFTPANDFWGNVTFFYRVTDGIHDSNMATAVISVVSPQSVIVTTAIDEQDGDLSPDDISLREAIDDLGASRIQFSESLLNQEIWLTLGTLNVDDVQIVGLGKQYLAINGNRQGTIFQVTDGETSVSNMIITGAGSSSAIRNINGDLTIQRCTVTDNYFGAILNDTGTTTCFASTIKNNIQGAICNGSGTVTINASTIRDNLAGNYGGAIYNTSGIVEVTNSSVIGNSASYGGAIKSYGGMLFVTDSTFLDNSARSKGGAIHAEYTTVTITDSTFEGNSAVADGGAAMVSQGLFTLTDSTFVENSADEHGGAIFVGYVDLRVTDSTFIDNSANDGGAIFVDKRTAKIAGSTFSQNIAGNDGGAIYNSVCEIVVLASVLTGNTADSDGGGLFNLGTLDVKTSTIATNSANGNGGGIFNGENTVTLLNSTLSENTAGYAGGGIYCSTYSGVDLESNLTAINSIFIDNAANNGGGGIYCITGTLTITNSTLIENTSNQNGGGIYIRNTDLSLNNSILAKNNATLYPDLYSYSCTHSGVHNLIGNGMSLPIFIDGVDGNQVGNMQFPLDPWLTDTGYPLGGSPVIDAGSNQQVPIEAITDITGNYRIANGTVDIGAYEVASSPLLPGDANCDGRVDGSDVTILAANWQAGVPDGDTENITWSMGDFNGDGKVDGSDVTILAGNWQTGVSLTAVAVSGQEVEEATPITHFTPPTDDLIDVATVPRRESLPPRRFISPTSESTDAALAESSWISSDVTAIAKDITPISVKQSTAASDKLFALELDPYADLE